LIFEPDYKVRPLDFALRADLQSFKFVPSDCPIVAATTSIKKDARGVLAVAAHESDQKIVVSMSHTRPAFPPATYIRMDSRKLNAGAAPRQRQRIERGPHSRYSSRPAFPVGS
jgi:hypothetical protein